MPRQLTRNPNDAMLGGVCGGLAEYFDVDANLVRLLFVVFAVVTSGAGALVYFALWLILPEWAERGAPFADRVRDAADEMADRARSIGADVRRVARRPDRGVAFLLGLALILLGIAFLLRNLGIVWMSWFAFGTLWPIFPILIGLAFLWRWMKGGR